jgi:hypothetical protein
MLERNFVETRDNHQIAYVGEALPLNAQDSAVFDSYVKTADALVDAVEPQLTPETLRVARLAVNVARGAIPRRQADDIETIIGAPELSEPIHTVIQALDGRYFDHDIFVGSSQIFQKIAQIRPIFYTEDGYNLSAPLEDDVCGSNYAGNLSVQSDDLTSMLSAEAMRGIDPAVRRLVFRRLITWDGRGPQARPQVGDNEELYAADIHSGRITGTPQRLTNDS